MSTGRNPRVVCTPPGLRFWHRVCRRTPLAWRIRGMCPAKAGVYQDWEVSLMKKAVVGFLAATMLLSVAAAAMAGDAVYKVKKASAPIKADGDLKEFAGVPSIDLELSDGGKVVSQTMWDETALYFAFTVADGTQANANTGGSIWNGDNVQISIDPENDKNAGGYAGDDYEFGFALTDEAGPDSYAWKLADGVEFDPTAQKFAVVHKGNVTTYEIILPLAQIAPTVLKKGSIFGADVLVNDDDGEGRTFVEWTPGIGASKDPSSYNNFELI